MMRATTLPRLLTRPGLRKTSRFASASAKTINKKGLALPQNHHESSLFFGLMVVLSMTGGAFMWEFKGILYGNEIIPPFDVLQLRRDIERLFDRKPHLLQQAMQLHWVSNSGFCYNTKSEGSTGTLDFSIKDNEEVKELVTELEKVKALREHEISNSDLWVFATSVAIQVANGPEIDYRFGRKDSEKATNHPVPCLANLATPDDIRLLFYRLGLNDQEAVCYIGGLVRPMKEPVFKMNNSFFKHVVEKEASNSSTESPVVKAIRSDHMFSYWCKRYANDEANFYEDYKSAFSLVSHSNLGRWGPLSY
eukprot:TRINITY_DN16006_c0_g1_i1.p1 TRINITY_DN16006_c0_g1~~TRINITY_DN16006_c0_g1_i1.p1  ORF type:complete len:307 (+),score=11.94 TRINITY_DN16006_c0_g1_i1:55-975(+)